MPCCMAVTRCSYRCCSTVVTLPQQLSFHTDYTRWRWWAVLSELLLVIFFFFFNIFDCRITQTSLDDVQQKWEEGRGGYRAQEEPITLWCRSRWRQEYFFIWMMLKEWHQLIKKKRFDEQKLHLRWGEGGEAVDNVFQCSWSQHC